MFLRWYICVTLPKTLIEFDYIAKRRDNISRVNSSDSLTCLANVSYKGECPIYLVHCSYIV